MNSHRRVIVLACVLAAIGNVRAADAAQLAREQAVQAEVDRRRQTRDAGRGLAAVGAVFQPVDETLLMGERIEIRDIMVKDCAPLLSAVMKKEVLMSAKVALKRVSAKTRVVAKADVAEALREALEAAGVALVAVTDSTIALVDAADVPKKPGAEK
jgi:hypothetical protein